MTGLSALYLLYNDWKPTGKILKVRILSALSNNCLMSFGHLKRNGCLCDNYTLERFCNLKLVANTNSVHTIISVRTKVVM